MKEQVASLPQQPEYFHARVLERLLAALEDVKILPAFVLQSEVAEFYAVDHSGGFEDDYPYEELKKRVNRLEAGYKISCYGEEQDSPFFAWNTHGDRPALSYLLEEVEKYMGCLSPFRQCKIQDALGEVRRDLARTPESREQVEALAVALHRHAETVFSRDAVTIKAIDNAGLRDILHTLKSSCEEQKGTMPAVFLQMVDAADNDSSLSKVTLRFRPSRPESFVERLVGGEEATVDAEYVGLYHLLQDACGIAPASISVAF